MVKLHVATAQFPVSASIARNLHYMRQLTQHAKVQKADVVHFSETCLGGYAGAEFKSWDGYDWAELKARKTICGNWRRNRVSAWSTAPIIESRPTMCAMRSFMSPRWVNTSVVTTSAFAPAAI